MDLHKKMIKTYIVMTTDAVYSGSSAQLTCRNFSNGVTPSMADTIMLYLQNRSTVED